jgi:glucan 1,3-beta-glucosidase
MGDPTNPPTLKAVSNFPSDHIIFAKDPVQPGTNNFYIAIKNLIIDSTNVDKATTIGHIDWTVSQATQLTNIVFNMPNFSTGHAGVTVALNYPPFPDPSGFNSALILNDLTFNGGATGMILNGQQWVLKGMSFNSGDTGNARNSIILENVINHGKTVVLDNGPNPPLTGNVPNTWVHGDMVTLILLHLRTLLTIHSMLQGIRKHSLKMVGS